MNTQRRHHRIDDQLPAVRAATRLCHASGSELLAELVASTRAIIGFAHVLVVTVSRNMAERSAKALVPAEGFEKEIVRLINDDVEFGEIVLRDVPRVQFELHASDVPFHPAIAPLVGTGLRHAYVFEISATSTERTVLVGFDDRSVAITMDDLDVLELFVSIVARALRAESVLTATELRVGQLQAALDSRIIIEQAKGALAERMKVSPDAAFRHLRQSARSARVTLPDAATSVIDTVVALAVEREAGGADSVVSGEGDNTVVHGFTV